MTEQEIKLIDDSIQAYKNMIKFHRKQILALERKKMVVPSNCSECIPLDIPIIVKK